MINDVILDLSGGTERLSAPLGFRVMEIDGYQVDVARLYQDSLPGARLRVFDDRVAIDWRDVASVRSR